MKRLTQRMPDGTAYLTSISAVNNAIDRLAEYEDTGLTPEEIHEMQTAHRTEFCEEADYYCVAGGYYRKMKEGQHGQLA